MSEIVRDEYDTYEGYVDALLDRIDELEKLGRALGSSVKETVGSISVVGTTELVALVKALEDKGDE